MGPLWRDSRAMWRAFGAIFQRWRSSLPRNDIVEAADHIAGFTADADFETFQKSEMMRRAVVQKLAIIGEGGAAA